MEGRGSDEVVIVELDRLLMVVVVVTRLPQEVG